MTRSRFALAGYFGFGNAGDEMILRCLRDNVRAPWVVLSSGGGPGTVNRWDPVSLARAFRGCRALVLGGGELFQSRTSFRSFLYYLFLVLWARLWGCGLHVHGAGIDPELSGLARRAVVRALKGARSLCVRDAASAEALRGAGLGGPIPVVPDPVWAWPAPELSPRSGALRRVLWILRFPSGSLQETDLWARALDRLAAEAPEWSHGFLAFHPEMDMPPLSRLRASLSFPHRLEAWKGLDDIPAAVLSYDAVVSMRFHGLVAASLCRRPAVAVAAHGKARRLALDLGYPALDPGEAGAAALARALRRAWADFGDAHESRARTLRAGALASLKNLEEILQPIYP